RPHPGADREARAEPRVGAPEARRPFARGPLARKRQSRPRRSVRRLARARPELPLALLAQDAGERRLARRRLDASRAGARRGLGRAGRPAAARAAASEAARGEPPAVRPDAVVFDLDGVLVDSEGAWQDAERETVSALGGVYTDELRAALHGRGHRDGGRIIAVRLGRDDGEAVAAILLEQAL